MAFYFGKKKLLLVSTLMLTLVYSCKTTDQAVLKESDDTRNRLFRMSDVEDNYQLSKISPRGTVPIARFKDTIKIDPNLASDQSAQRAYDPVFFTLGATLASKNFPQRKNWKRVDLEAADKDNQYYLDKLSLYVSKVSNPNNLMFILGSSFSTWESETWVHNLVAAIDEKNPNTTIIYMPGFLSQDAMGFNPVAPPLYLQAMGEDIYLRLRRGILDAQGYLGKKLNVSIAGMSGGGTLAMLMLNIDRKYSETQNIPRAFNSGALALSPIIDISNVFYNIDANVARLRKERPSYYDTSLTSTSTILRFGMKLKDPYNGLQIADDKNSDTFKLIRDLFFNQFIVKDLATLAKQAYKTPSFKFLYDLKVPIDKPVVERSKNSSTTIKASSYQAFYEQYAYQSLFTNFKNQVPFKSFDNIAAMDYIMADLKDPVYLVFATDDPIFGVPQSVDKSFKERAQSKLDSFFKNFANHPQLQIFNPNRGGHMGYFLDFDWLVSTMDRFINREK